LEQTAYQEQNCHDDAQVPIAYGLAPQHRPQADDVYGVEEEKLKVETDCRMLGE
jgi:aspartate-semialdehyde dehydrogenase